MIALTWRPTPNASFLQTPWGDTVALVARYGYGWAYNINASRTNPRYFGFVPTAPRAKELVESFIAKEAFGRFCEDELTFRDLMERQGDR